MVLDIGTLTLLGLYLIVMACLPLLLALVTRWRTQWVPPVKRVFAWYALSFESFFSFYLFLFVQSTFFARNRDISIWMLGAALVLGMTGLLGIFRFGKRLAALRLQYPAQR